MTSTALTELREFSRNAARWTLPSTNVSQLYSQAVRKLLPPYAAAVDGLIERLNAARRGRQCTATGRADAALYLAGRNRPPR